MSYSEYKNLEATIESGATMVEPLDGDFWVEGNLLDILDALEGAGLTVEDIRAIIYDDTEDDEEEDD